MTSQNTQSLDERETPKPQAGEWTLTAPDGRTWKADSPLKTAGYEQRERVPAEVAVERIFAACENAEPAGAGLRLVPEVPNESVLLFLMGGLVEPQEADELQDEITQEEADAINDRCRTDARLHYAEILNIATKDAA